jgi:hypothetical protein
LKAISAVYLYRSKGEGGLPDHRLCGTRDSGANEVHPSKQAGQPLALNKLVIGMLVPSWAS